MRSRINDTVAAAMEQIPDLKDLPRTVDTLMRPWVGAVESAGHGKGALVYSAAVSAAGALRRYVLVTSDINEALVSARATSDTLARELSGSGPIADERAIALEALAVLIDRLRQSQPSETTRALKLGW